MAFLLSPKQLLEVFDATKDRRSIANTAVKANRRLGIVKAKNLSAKTRKKWGIPPGTSDQRIDDAIANAKFKGRPDIFGNKRKIELETTVGGQKVDFEREKTRTKRKDGKPGFEETVDTKAVVNGKESLDMMVKKAHAPGGVDDGILLDHRTTVRAAPGKPPHTLEELGVVNYNGKRINPQDIAKKLAKGNFKAKEIVPFVGSRSGAKHGPLFINPWKLKEPRFFQDTEPDNTLLDLLANPWVVVPAVLVVYGGAVFVTTRNQQQQ